MKIRTLALSLALATASPQGVWPSDLERTSRVIETALALPPDSPVVVKTRAKAAYRGRLLAVTDSHITVRTLQSGAIADLTLPYADIHSIKRTDKPMSPAKVVLLTLGVLYGIYGIGVIVGAAVNH